MDNVFCRIGPQRNCWKCIEVYHDMIARLATGATLHGLNNQLMSMRAACLTGDQEAYVKARARFIELGRIGVELREARKRER